MHEVLWAGRLQDRESGKVRYSTLGKLGKVQYFFGKSKQLALPASFGGKLRTELGLGSEKPCWIWQMFAKVGFRAFSHAWLIIRACTRRSEFGRPTQKFQPSKPAHLETTTFASPFRRHHQQRSCHQTAKMADADSPVTLRTRKFIRNPLLGRKQMVV